MRKAKSTENKQKEENNWKHTNQLNWEQENNREKSIKQKRWFFENISKIDKLDKFLTRWTMKEKRHKSGMN